MSVGINTNIEYGLDMKSLYAEIKNAGFNNVMIAFKEAEIEESILEAKRLGLNIPYVHLSCREANAFWVNSPVNVKYINKLKNEIDICSKYNIPIAIIHPIAGNPNTKPVGVNKKGLESVLEVVNYAISKNVHLAIENVDKESLKYLDYILENIPQEKLGYCYDTGHHNLYYPKIDILKKYSNRVIAIHLHDNYMDYKKYDDYTKDRHLLPFDGKLNYENITSNIAQSSYNNVIMLEVNKKTLGNPDKYKMLTLEEYLKEAKKRVDVIEKMIKEKKEILK
ncbi:MAG: sugar phosphate isomerase/epimerase [Clostridia bacterium]|nr:sugar phosphate isomerase/epimerase [Clostridia bacterium]